MFEEYGTRPDTVKFRKFRKLRIRFASALTFHYICIMAGNKQTTERAATTLRIGNMVCPRCIMAVRALLAEEGFPQAQVTLGSAEIDTEITQQQRDTIRRRLEQIGFTLIEDPRQELVERIRLTVTALARGGRMKLNLSQEITGAIGHDYSSLSKLFSATQGCTIERYFILQKIERAKELLLDTDLPLADIAEQTGYSSAAYLSAQFRSVEGTTPSEFRRNGAARRKSIDAV